MSDPSIALVLIPIFLAALTVASWFRTMDASLWRESHVPLLTGLACGAALAFLPIPAPLGPVASGLLLTASALYVRLIGRESEPSQGMLLGAVSGAAAAGVLLFAGEALLRLPQCLLAGAAAGYGITFGVSHARDRARQVAFDLATAVAAVTAAAVPGVLAREGLAVRHLAIAAAAVIPLLAVASVFFRAPLVAAELAEESAHGFIAEEDVRTTAHPLRRLFRSGWHSAGAHREFVRIATRIALRKRQQRRWPDAVARIYQLEVIKLRMELQEMARIDGAMRARAEAAGEPKAGEPGDEARLQS